MSMDSTASLLLKKQLAELMKSPDSGEFTCNPLLNAGQVFVENFSQPHFYLIDFEPEN
jgi:hypothetical protein